MNNSLNATQTGQFLLAIGIVSVLAFILLLIFFVGYFNNMPSLYIFGSLNDILGSSEAILSAILATILVFSASKRWIWLNGIGALLSWTGAFIATLDSLMAGDIIPKNTAVILRTQYGFPSLLTTHDLHFGFGLIGIWLVIIIVQAAQTKAWPNHIIGLGLITGIIMVMGLSGDSPLGIVFLYPIWCIVTGRYILKTQKGQLLMDNSSLLKYGRMLLFIPATLLTLLILFVIGIFLSSGGEQFMLDDFGQAWIMLTKQYPHVAEDFLHTMKNNLITSLGVGLYSLTTIKFAFKHGQRWAWFIMWILPLSMIEDIFYGISKGFGFEYLFGGFVTLAVLGLLISYREFFPR